ncbi:hypothetical protein [Streptomyces scopuliridis]|uniref:hypothetical protein n=1 Tax=Streptomyces scopuliridis TaxID=452529 RepID=UPI0036827CC9
MSTYARAEDGQVVRVGADRGTVDRDTPRRATASARPADRAPDNSVPEGASG